MTCFLAQFGSEFLADFETCSIPKTLMCSESPIIAGENTDAQAPAAEILIQPAGRVAQVSVFLICFHFPEILMRVFPGPL